MKKFYETPAVEFTGFNAEDVITTSIIETIGNADGVAKLEGYVTDKKVAGVQKAVSYDYYQW